MEGNGAPWEVPRTLHLSLCPHSRTCQGVQSLPSISRAWASPHLALLGLEVAPNLGESSGS